MASYSFAHVSHSFVSIPSKRRLQCCGYNKDLPSKSKAKSTGSAQSQSSPTTTNRRSANYKPSTWRPNDIDSLRKDNVLDINDNKVERLKTKVKHMVGDKRLELSTLLTLIDDIQRLGLTHHFDEDIESILSRLQDNIDVLKLDLNSTALIFRLFRQNGIWISQDEFTRFKDDKGNFMPSLGKDIKGMLNLYEASYLALEGEHLLDEANAFSKKHLSEQICSIENKFIVDYVKYTLETPLHYTLPRIKARDSIETYQAANGNDLLELAKLDFNMVQAMHQKELQELSMWWRSTDLATRFDFSRDNLTECYFVGMGAVTNPQFGACRKALTKVYMLMTIIDDIYDVHGYLDELELFTNAIERWNINDIDQLPDYMRSIFVAIYNATNEIGNEILEEKGQNYIPFLKKSWEDICKAFLVEAKWYYNGQIPTFEEYLNNAWVTIAMALGLTHAFFYVTPKITPEGLHCLLNNPDILRLPSANFRLANDLVSSKAELERGEVANAISCYVKQYNVSSEDARKHMGKLIDENWKRLNAIIVANETPFAKDLMDISINAARLAKCMYQHGDGYSSPDLMKKRVSSLLIEPVQ